MTTPAEFVAVNLDPFAAHETMLHFPLPDMGIGWHDPWEVEELLTGQRFFGNHDWYREGAEELVHEQDKLLGYWDTVADRLATVEHLVFACGRYEGIDQRVRREVQHVGVAQCGLDSGFRGLPALENSV